jgi:Tfp pilus assembly protein PilX
MQQSANKKHVGAVTLFMSVVLMTISTLIVLFAANYSFTHTKAVLNHTKNQQAYHAAQAGLEYGIAYVAQHGSTITGSPVSGYVNYGSADMNLTNVSLANYAKYSVTYTNPVANNYRLLAITSTGVSDDGTATEIVRQQVYASVSSLNAAITTQGDLVSSGDVSIVGPNGVHAGGSVTQSGNVTINSIVQNDTMLRDMTSDALFSSVFGVSKASMQAQSTYFANTSGLQYNTLTGKNWINSNVVISGNNTIGTPSNPVLLVINGSLIASGTVNIYGVVYVMGGLTMLGNVNFIGGVVAEGAVTVSGSVGTYNSSIVSAFAASHYAKVPGSWKDF